MSNSGMVITAMVVLAAGTYAFRLAGPMLRSRVTFPAHVEQLMETSAIVLLAALVATTALTEGNGLAGVARPAGVVAAGVLAWRRLPFLVVIVTAAAVTALLRLLGVP